MYFFTSDTHFNHEKVIKFNNRPFSDLDEMTEALIDNWNAVVPKGGVVFHLGDFGFSYGKKSLKTVDGILRRLNGSKFLITGNHDRKEVVKSNLWAKVTPYHEIKVEIGKPRKQRIVMCHYALRTWNQSHRGSICLHGHSHGSLPQPPGKIMDVGVDCRNYFPVSLEEVLEFTDGREIFSEDHHKPKIDT